MNATNKFDDRKASSTFTRLAPIERMEMEGLEVTNRLMALPFFIITFSMTALISLTVFQVRLTAQQHDFVAGITIFSCGAMLLALVHFLKTSPKTLLIYSIVSALILGLLAPLSW